MACIPGLTEEQCTDLADIQEGDLIIIRSRAVAEDGEFDEESQDYEGGDGDEYEAEDDDGDDDDDDEEESYNDDDGTGSEEDQSNDSEGASEDDEEAFYEESDADELDNAETAAPVPAAVYKVIDTTRDDDDDITDLKLRPMSHCLKPAQKTSSSFHFYGTEIVLSTIESDGKTTSQLDKTLTDLVADNRKQHEIIVNCSAAVFFQQVFCGLCPARCIDGWISTQQQMHELVEENILTVTEHRPVCPVCVGKDLMLQHQGLREMLESGHVVDMGVLVEFYGQLNPRRTALGYSFKQFDEREWGYLFDDMQSEDEDGDNGHDTGNAGWQYYAEAMDPAAGVTAKPAAESAVAALPRKTFAQAKKNDDDDDEVACQVCKERFTDETVVAQLPCGHFFCSEGCTEMWLKESASCPVCRYQLPLKEDEERGLKAGMAQVSGNGAVAGGTNDGSGAEIEEALDNGDKGEDGDEMDIDTPETFHA